MSFFDYDKKETVHLWGAIFITIMLALLRSLSLVAEVSGVCRFVTVLPTNIYIIISLFTVLLLWVSYRRWVKTIRQRDELEFVIKSIGPDVIMVVDSEMTIVMCNDAVEEIFGYRPDEVIGKKTSVLYFDRRITGDKREIYNRIITIGIHRGFAKGKCKDGQIIPLEITTGDLPNRPGVVILVRDITEIKRVENELIEAKEKAEEVAVKLKKIEDMRDSLSNMIVHDLKSPLTAISGYLELISRTSDGNLDVSCSGFLDEALRLTYQLGDMINSLLDMSRLEHNKMPLNRMVFDVKRCCDRAMDVIGPDGVNKNITIILPVESVFAFGDSDIVQRVVMNLIGNAIKFTPGGGMITIGAKLDGEFVRVVVSDTGSGIPKEFHEKVFSKFAQFEAKKFSTGIGLTFCKLAIEAHGGEIGIDSEVGQGSRLWFTIPATPTSVGE